MAETYQSKVNDGTLSVRRTRRNMLCVEGIMGIGQQLVEAVRADFNGDGIEDVLVFEYTYAVGGSFGAGSIRMLTRRANDCHFEIVPPISGAPGFAKPH